MNTTKLARRSEWLTGGAKGVASGKLPHPRKELSEATTEKCHTDDDVGDIDATSTDIVKGQDQSR
jgi:hypothetical protein